MFHDKCHLGLHVVAAQALYSAYAEAMLQISARSTAPVLIIIIRKVLSATALSRILRFIVSSPFRPLLDVHRTLNHDVLGLGGQASLATGAGKRPIKAR